MSEISVITQNNAVEFDKTRRDLLKDFLCKSSKRQASNGELELFISTCERLQLDPFARQIFAVFRWDTRVGKEVMNIQTSIDGYRAIAERTGRYQGQEGPYWCGPDGVWKDVWLSDKFPSAAKVGVIKAGHTKPTWAVARWSSYVQRTKRGIAKMWESMPDLMLSKCAEALALRKAFPQDLSGVYTDVEMAQAEIVDVEAPVKEPEPTRYGNGQEITDVFIRPTDDTTITKEICPEKFYWESLEGKRLGDDQDDKVRDYQGKTYTFHLKDKSPKQVKDANNAREYEWLLGVHEVRKRRKAREEEELRELKVALVQEAKELAIHSESKKEVLKEAYKRAGMRPTEGDKSLESFDAKRLERLIPFFIEAEKAASVGKPRAGTRRRSRVSANSRPRGVVGAVLREIRAPRKAERAAKAQVYREQITAHLRSLGSEDQSNQAWWSLLSIVNLPPSTRIEQIGFKMLNTMIRSMERVTV